MINLILSFVIALVAAVMPWSVYSSEVNIERADQLIKKYNINVERPKSCPMESRKFADFIDKTNAIKDVLKGNCLKKESDKMTEVLESIKGIQDDIKNQSIVNSSATTDLLNATGITSSTATGATGALSGLKFSALFSNITTLFKKNQCNLDDGRVLEMTADLIYDSTQLGILAGNQMGLIVAGSGFLLSSALRLIDLIFKQRFDFEKPADRQTFVKLNCAFYDIRRELDINGALDIENSSSRDDYRDVKALVEELTVGLRKIEEEKMNVTKTNAAIDQENFKKDIGDLVEFKRTLAKIQKYLLPGLNQTLDIPTETQKLLMISQLAQDYDLLKGQLNHYKDLKISSIPMLDDLFINEMQKFDSLSVQAFTDTLNISAKDFNDSYRAKILFHIMRIDGDITKKEQSIQGKGDQTKKDLAKTLEAKKDLYLAKLSELKKVVARLGSVVSPKEYSGLDDGSENMVSIIDNHNKISSQLYGEWGDKFLKFATSKSYEEVKSFNERLGLFNTKYSEIIKKNKQDNLATTYLCQDAQKLRLIFKHADSLVQEGFDFIVTNKDIIYSDVKNYYNGTINDSGIYAIGPVERIQRHYKSSLLALKQMKGETIPTEENDRYLGKPWMSNFFLGRSMIEVSTAKNQAREIQDIYERLGCQKSLAAEFGI